MEVPKGNLNALPPTMVTGWINLKFNVNFQEDELINIKDFSLLWNVFESKVCGNHFSIPVVDLCLAANNLQMEDFIRFLTYFQQRYIENGAINARYPFLNFQPNNREPFVRDVLLGNLVGTNERILAMIIIVYRFRNNLFHGVKQMHLINEQRENFEIANDFLMTFLNKTIFK